MTEYFVPKIPIDDKLINEQFVEVSNLKPKIENIQWNKYMEVYESIYDDKINIFNKMYNTFDEIIRWIQIDKSSQEYKELIVILSVALNSLKPTEISEEDVFKEFINKLVNNLEDHIFICEQYFNAVNTLERKKFNYALKFGDCERDDLDEDERYSSQDVLDYLDSLNTSKYSYDYDLIVIKYNVRMYESNEYVKQAIKILTRSA